jgi:hypothetical protein
VIAHSACRNGKQRFPRKNTRVPTKEFSLPGEPLRYHRTTGLMMSQMQELVSRVNDALPGPWNKKAGRPKLCGLYEAVETTCMYIRHNATQEFLGDLRDASQSTVSRMVSTLTPIVKAVLEKFVPDAAEAINMVNGLRGSRSRFRPLTRGWVWSAVGA